MTERFLVENRLIIRPITMEDTDMVVRWRNNPRVLNNFIYRGEFNASIHQNWMKTKVETGLVKQYIVEECQPDGSSMPIGSVYFRDLDMDKKTAEYGIFIGEDDAVGHGDGTLIAKWAVEYAGEVLGLKTLTLRAFADNESAVRSYTRVGFVPYETIPQFMDGRDLVLMKVDYTERKS